MLHHAEARHLQLGLELGERAAVTREEPIEEVTPRRISQCPEHAVVVHVQTICDLMVTCQVVFRRSIRARPSCTIVDNSARPCLLPQPSAPHRIVLEVIVESVADAREAARGGADRLEVVRALELGGLTPPLTLVREIAEAVSLPLRVMVRGNAGYATTPRNVPFSGVTPPASQRWASTASSSDSRTPDSRGSMTSLTSLALSAMSGRRFTGRSTSSAIRSARSMC